MPRRRNLRDSPGVRMPMNGESITGVCEQALQFTVRPISQTRVYVAMSFHGFRAKESSKVSVFTRLRRDANWTEISLKSSGEQLTSARGAMATDWCRHRYDVRPTKINL